MNTHVKFVTDVFEMDTPQAHFINPCCFGEDCANWLADKLKARGFEVDEVFQEDWGWCFYVKVKRSHFWIGVGLVEEEKNWLVFCESNFERLKKLFGRFDKEAQAQLCQGIDELLKTTSHISAIKWYEKENYLRGKDE
jgi:hypothetical protein